MKTLNNIESVVNHPVMQRLCTQTTQLSGGLAALRRLRSTLANRKRARRNAREDGGKTPALPSLDYARTHVQEALEAGLPEGLREAAEAWLDGVGPGDRPERSRADEMRAIRERLGMTQGQMAERLGVALNTVSRWERGVMGMRESALRMARMLVGRRG